MDARSATVGSVSEAEPESKPTDANDDAPTAAPETPKTETPKTETPKAETPKAETPKAAASRAETPKAGDGDGDADGGPATVIADPDTGRTRIIKPAAAPKHPRKAPAARTEAATAAAAPVSGAPGFGKPSRPAWQPMTVRAPSSGARGITILGTTLTRRQTVIAAGVLVAVLLVALVVLVPLAFGDEEGDQARDNGTAGVGPSASAAGKPSTVPSSAPAAGPAPTTPKGPASSAAVSKAPVTVRVPNGWRLYQGDGYSVPVPNGASVRAQGTEVYFTKNNRLLIIDHSEQPKADPVADWEFTYTTSSGNPQRAVKRGFITTPGKQAYSISWYTSPDDWAASQKDLQVIYQGFKAD